MKTISCLPPEIKQIFNGSILSIPCPKLRQHGDDLLRFFKKIKTKLEKRTLRLKERNNRFQAYEKEFLELYGRIKTKEKELEEKTNHCTQVFGYRFPDIDRKGQEIFGRFEFG